MTRFIPHIVTGVAMMFAVAAGVKPEAAFATNGTSIVMTGVVPTRCETSFSRAPVAIEGQHKVDLGIMMRRCNNGDGYRLVLHLGHRMPGGVFVIGARQIPLSSSGETIIIDSNRDEIASEPAFIEFASDIPAGAIDVKVAITPKGVIY